MRKPQAVVTGIGIIAPGGLSKEAFFHSLASEASGLKRNEMLVKLGVKSEVAGGVDQPYRRLELPVEEERLIGLAIAAIDEAMENSRITRQDLAKLGARAGLSFSTSVAGHERIAAFVRNLLDNKDNSPDWLIDVPSCTAQLTSHTGIHGPVYTTMSACAAGTAGAGIALDAIRNGTTDVMVVVGSDALIDTSIAGFHSLQSMSVDGCMPFDKNRDGMTLGEGAAAFIVETLDRAAARGAYIYGELLGYGLGNDAYHITSPDPEGEGAYRTMMMALRDAGLEPADIDYINAHGTATELNDIMEIRSISKLFGSSDEQPRVMISSTKSVTGHCLGAAGSVELAVALFAVDRNIAPSTVRLREPSEEFKAFRILETCSTDREINFAMSNSFAFSGNSASIIVGKVSNRA